MRVISGSARGRKLNAPKGLETRPTTDRVKESVFNIISRYLPARFVLDLFAGSGALGVEALSRGCKNAVFVDSGKEAACVVKCNVEAAKVTERATVLCCDYKVFLESTRKAFDLIFLDPPYNTGLLSDAILKIEKNALLEPGGIIVAETEHLGEKPPECGFETVKFAKYGNTEIYILRNTCS